MRHGKGSSLILLLVLLNGNFGLCADNGERNLVISTFSFETTFNPIRSYFAAEAQYYTALYEGLVTYHPFTLEPVPGIAKSWQVSPDGKTYRFTLRSNARFSNGDFITAEDVRNTWLAVLDPKRKAEYSFLLDIVSGAEAYRTGRNPDPASVGIRAVSASVLEVELIHPASYFLKILCHHSFVPLHPSLRKLDDFRKARELIGNGPFYLYTASDREMVFLKNNLYWDAANIGLDRITVTFERDTKTITDLFNAGSIHWAAGDIDWERVVPDDAVLMNQMYATTYYYFDAGTPPWNNREVRRALALLVPWDEIRSEDHLFIPASTLVPRVSGYPKVRGIDGADQEEAFALLERNGYPKGQGLPEIRILIPAGNETRREAEIMKQAWEASIEADVVLEEIPAEGYYERLKEVDYTVATLTWIGDYADPLTFLQLWTSESNLNDARYADREFDRMITASMGEPDAERYRSLGKAEEYLLSGAVVMPVSYTPAFNCIDLTVVDGWYPNPLDIHPFRWIRFAEPELPPGIVRLRESSVPAARTCHRKAPSP